MARDKRERSKVNHIEGELRSLEKENKHLKKQLARADKAVNILHSLSDPDSLILSEPEPLKDDKCPDCKGKLSVIDFGIKTVISCKSCSYRKTIKN